MNNELNNEAIADIIAPPIKEVKRRGRRKKNLNPDQSSIVDTRSMKSVSATAGIPLANLKAAKALDLPGFNRDNTINWEVLKPLYYANIDRIEEFLDNSIDRLKKEKLKREIIIKDLDIAELKKQLVDISEIKDFMTVFATKLNGLLLTKIVTELPTSLTGKTEEEIRYCCKLHVNQIIDILKQQDINKWDIKQ